MSDVYLPKQVVVGLAIAINRVHKKDILGNIFEMLNHPRVFFKKVYTKLGCNEEREGIAYDCRNYKCCIVIETEQQCYKCPATLTTIKVSSGFTEAAERYIDSMYETYNVEDLVTFTKEFEEQWSDYFVDIVVD